MVGSVQAPFRTNTAFKIREVRNQTADGHWTAALAVAARVEEAGDFSRVQRAIVNADFVNESLEVLAGALASADAEIILRGRNRAGTIVGVREHAVGVGLDNAVGVGHGEVGPLVRRRFGAGVDPGKAGRGVGKRPLDVAIAPAGDFIFIFLVDDDAARAATRTRTGGINPKLERAGQAEVQRRLRPDLHVGSGSVK